MKNKISISNILILISIIVTLLSFKFNTLQIFWMNHYFLNQWEYYNYILQFFIYNFIHWDMMHLLFNSIFIYYFWNILESIIWKNKFIIFFIFISIFNWVLLTIFQESTNTFWISWFALAILTYYTLELKSKWNSDYKWGITAIILNIIIWFMPWISLLWHLFWAIGGIIFYFLTKTFFSKQEIGFIEKIKQVFKESIIRQPENFSKIKK